MKLNSENRTSLVRYGHDGAIIGFCIDHQFVRHRFPIDDQRVIARRSHRRWTTIEKPLACMTNLSHFSVDRNRPANDARAERFADRLMAKTDAEKRDGLIGANEVDDTARASWSSRPGRDDDRRRFLGDQRRGIEGVIAEDANGAPGEALDLLHEVVGEGIVIIDDGDRRAKDAPGRWDGCSWRR